MLQKLLTCSESSQDIISFLMFHLSHTVYVSEIVPEGEALAILYCDAAKQTTVAVGVNNTNGPVIEFFRSSRRLGR